MAAFAESPSTSRILINSGVQIVIDVDERVWPQPFLQFLPGHHLAWPLQQGGEHLKGLAREPQFHSRVAQFSRGKVNFEGSEPD
jgi:hypothetical protein